MKTFQEIHIRDPFIMVYGGKYYLYGTRCRGNLGLDVYVSDDLVHWSDAVEAFTPPVGFWADRDFWAPEVHAYKGAYYMFVSFKSETACRGTQILKSESPMGPFVPHSDGPVTPRDWECLDGTLYVSRDGKPYMVFCHEWVQVRNGEMCCIELSDDLSRAVGGPKLLFRAAEPEWVRPIDGDGYVTDGPFMYRTQNGTLLMIWASFSEKGYCEAIARSDNGEIDGNWTHDSELLFREDGGHGMIFRTLEGDLKFIFHQPNNSPDERPHLVALREKEESVVAC